MKVKVNRLYNGIASVRDYLVDRALSNYEELTLELVEKDEEWRIPFHQINKYGKKSKIVSRSIYTGKPYRLIDFKWPKKIEQPDGQGILL